MNFAEVPELRAYWTPLPGYSSSNEIFVNNFTLTKRPKVGLINSFFEDLAEKNGVVKKENRLNDVVDCKYVTPPVERKQRETNLFWKGIR